jgi:hypothetical protein
MLTRTVLKRKASVSSDTKKGGSRGGREAGRLTNDAGDTVFELETRGRVGDEDADSEY